MHCNSKIPLAPKVGQAEGENKICEMWKDYFSSLLNDPECYSPNSESISNINECTLENVPMITCREVEESIMYLKKHKSPGPDRLVAEHYIYASKYVTILLALLFSAGIVHGHLPASFTHSILVPILKDKNGDHSDTNNYRPIYLSKICQRT